MTVENQVHASRSYDPRTAALALGVPLKWIDNTLSHHNIRGVNRAWRGIERQLTFEAVTLLFLARLLCSELGVPLATAIGLGRRLMDSADQQIGSPAGVMLGVDVARVAHDLQLRLSEISETTARMKRGRLGRAEESV